MKQIQATAGIVLHEDKILIAQRKPDDKYGNFWEFPGGKCEEGESEEDCLRREMKEELGIEVEVAQKAGTYQMQYPDRVFEMHFFWCRWAGGEPRPLECQDFRWVTRAEIAAYNFLPADRDLVGQLATGELQFHG